MDRQRIHVHPDPLRESRMDTRYLHFFVQAEQCGSFAKAAKNLFISQQGLSAAIARLESELNCTLLYRTPKGIRLTKEGEYFLPRAKRILETIEECNRHFSVAVTKKPLRLVCSYGVLGMLKDTVLGDFQEREAPLEIAECPDLECEKRLLGGDADVGLLSGPLDKNVFETGLLFKHTVLLIVHKSHSLSACAEIETDRLRGEPIISLNENFRMYRRLAERCREAGFEPRIVHRAGELASVHKLVAKKRGIGLTVDFFFEDMPSDAVTALQLRPTLDWDVHVAVTRNAGLVESARAFFQHMLSAYHTGNTRQTVS